MTIAYHAFEHATEELPDAIMLSWCSKCTAVQFHDVAGPEPGDALTELQCWQCYHVTLHNADSLAHEQDKQGQYSEDYFQDLGSEH